MKEYRIALFTVDWNYELVESSLQGVKQFVDERQDIRLFVFDCFGKELDDEKGRSEYMIFDLPDISGFDGALVQGNQIVLDYARRRLARRIREAGVPAVTIGCSIDGCTLVGIDNHDAQYDITAHVIKEHGARRLAYLTGILDNGCPEGLWRRDGFLDACREHGILEEDITLIPCSWRTSDGAEAARRWLQSGKPLPDAFLCANDEMGLGLIGVLKEHGYRIPEDVIVAGFDNVPSAELSSPRLATVDGNYAALNHYAMQVLLDKIDGREQRERIVFPHRLILSDSCGCQEITKPGYIREKYYRQTRFLKNFYSLQDQMAAEMFNASDLSELLEIIEKHHPIFGCRSIYLCINDYYFDNYEKKQWKHDARRFGQEVILAACSRCDLSAEGKHQYARFESRQLLPGDLIRDERFLVFYPLHYNTYCIGYIVMDSISEAAKLNLHESIFNFLEIAIENVRKKCLLRQLNSVLDDLYVHDALTGVYNRFGYKRFGQEVYELLLEEDGSAQVLFIDMDNMKGINDRFGHEAGDAAIKATAQLLQEACGARDFIMRYGGDEFLIIASGKEKDLKEQILARAETYAQRSGAPYNLGLSIGAVHTDGNDDISLDAHVQAADARMYEAKNQRKKAGCWG